MIGDTDLKCRKLYGMLPAGAGDTCDGRTAADNATVRNVYVIGPDKKIKLVISYPMSTGRNFDEVLRVIDSLQLTAKHKVATPVNWKDGDDVIIPTAVSDDAREGQVSRRLEDASSRTCASSSSPPPRHRSATREARPGRASRSSHPNLEVHGQHAVGRRHLGPPHQFRPRPRRRLTAGGAPLAGLGRGDAAAASHCWSQSFSRRSLIGTVPDTRAPVNPAKPDATCCCHHWSIVPPPAPMRQPTRTSNPTTSMPGVVATRASRRCGHSAR